MGAPGGADGSRGEGGLSVGALWAREASQNVGALGDGDVGLTPGAVGEGDVRRSVGASWARGMFRALRVLCGCSQVGL